MASRKRTSKPTPLHLEPAGRAASPPPMSPCHAAPVELARGVGRTSYLACSECGLEVKPAPDLAGRRSFLVGGVAAAGAALLPSPTLAAGAPLGDALEPFREKYRRRLERIAVELRPRFVSGELHGFNDADERADQADRGHQASILRLEQELEERHVQSCADAYLILACSASEELVDGGRPLTDVQAAAAEAMALDLLRIARRRGWYRPDMSEEPSAAELGA